MCRILPFILRLLPKGIPPLTRREKDLPKGVKKIPQLPVLHWLKESANSQNTLRKAVTLSLRGLV